MAVQPNSVIRFHKGIPIDSNYINTLWFANVAQQTAYFNNHIYRTYQDTTYQRVNSNIIRCGFPADEINNCNYISFLNTNYTTKWFYAFIKSVNYVSDNSCEVEYEIDSIQTYLFDVTLRECLVEREHSSSDNVGDNIISENLEVGDYFSDNPIETQLFTDYAVVLVSPYTFVPGVPETLMKSWVPKYITKNKSILQNYYYYKGESDPNVEMADLIVDLMRFDTQGITDEIVTTYTVPAGFVEKQSTENPRGELPSGMTRKVVQYVETKPTKLGTYTPRNKKLLTFPYNFFTINNFQEERAYRYEFINSANVTFNIYANLNANCSFKACPLNYKGEAVNFEEGIIMTDLPQFPFSGSLYKDWLARNKTKAVLGAIGTVAPLIAQPLETVHKGEQMLTKVRKQISAAGKRKIAEGFKEMEDNTFPIASSLVSTMTNNADERQTVSKGSPDGSLEIAMGKKDFLYTHKYINPQYASIIDEYFDMYGYSTRKVKVPNRHVRKHWTYTKTNGCTVVGDAPAEEIQMIGKIYDKGIRFWVNASEVGNYTDLASDNTPI